MSFGYSLGAILSGYEVTQTPQRFKTCVLAGDTPRFQGAGSARSAMESSFQPEVWRKVANVDLAFLFVQPGQCSATLHSKHLRKRKLPN